MRRIFALSIIGVLILGCHSSPGPVLDSDVAELRLEKEYPFRQSLHEAQREPDGVRAVGFAAPNAAVAADPNPLPPPFATTLEWKIYGEYCGWDAIVRATFLDSQADLARDKSVIYTVSRFSIVDIIKSDVRMRPGQTIVVYRIGGAVEDDGERLRIDTPDWAAFEAHQDYILVLDRDKNASVQQYFAPSAPTIAVTNEKMDPIPGRFAWLSGLDALQRGSTYTDFRNSFINVHAMKSCSDAR